MGKVRFFDHNGNKVKISKTKVCSAYLGKEGKIMIGYYSGEWVTYQAQDYWEAINAIAKINN